MARGAAREPCEADGSRDHGEAMTLSLAGIGVHGGCRQCTRGLGACGVVFVIMQRRCGCGCAAGAHWPLPMLQVVGRAWISFQSTLAAPGAEKFNSGTCARTCRCAACLDSFVERSWWLHRWSVPWLRHHLRLYGQANLDLRVACTTCGCPAASDAAAWPHARSGSAPNFAYVFVCTNEDNL